MATHTESTRFEDEKLEKEVKEMAKKLIELRSTLPTHINSTISSLFISLRPSFSLSYDVSLFPGGNSFSETLDGEVAAEDGERTADDIKLLNDKISSNISAMPKVLKRMNDCLSRFDSLVSSNETCHPTFKRKRR